MRTHMIAALISGVAFAGGCATHIDTQVVPPGAKVVVLEKGHVCGAHCGHIHSGGKVYRVAGHVHGAGCGHEFRGGVWAWADHREDVADRREDIRDRQEDVRDSMHDGGLRDRLEDIRDRQEDIRDRREDRRDRRTP